MFISREEKEKRVIDLYYNQGKTTREIAKELRVSPNYISAALKKKEEEEKNNSIVTNNQHQSSSSLSAKAYELFSKGKTSVEVVIALNLNEPEVTKLYIEYWKLRHLDKLYSTYIELGDDGIGDFLKLYTRAKKEGISIEQVVKLPPLADENNDVGLSFLEKKRDSCIDEIHELDIQIERSENHLQSLSNQIANARNLLSDLNTACKNKRQELETLNNEISRLKALKAVVTRFKSNDEEDSILDGEQEIAAEDQQQIDEEEEEEEEGSGE
jgi:DNA-binding MarR family transcriptional regulator